MIMNNLKKAMPRTWNYWNIQKPVYLKHQTNWDGVTVAPEHNTKQVLKAQEVIEDVIVITPIHEEPKGNITRAFGDLLTEEVV